jgi:hypothetical protein
MVNRNIRWNKDIRTNIVNFDGDILIQIIETEYNLPDCFFYLKADKVKRGFFVKDITFQGNLDIQEHEVTGYLKGYFGFLTQESIEKSLIDLQEILNDTRALPEQSETIWHSFVEQFNEWFKKKLKPCLAKELELYEMYHYIDYAGDIHYEAGSK